MSSCAHRDYWVAEFVGLFSIDLKHFYPHLTMNCLWVRECISITFDVFTRHTLRFKAL